MNKCSCSGFTLLETLLAITIFTLMSLAIYQSLIIVVKGSDAVKKKAKQINELNIVINILESNISHAIVSSHLIDEKVSGRNFRFGKSLLESDDFGICFFLNTHTEPYDYIKSEMVGFRLRNRYIEKLNYDLNENSPRVSKIIGDVTGFRIQIYQEPAGLNEWNEKQSLPKAVEVIIELGNQGRVRRVITLLNNTS